MILHAFCLSPVHLPGYHFYLESLQAGDSRMVQAGAGLVLGFPYQGLGFSDSRMVQAGVGLVLGFPYCTTVWSLESNCSKTHRAPSEGHDSQTQRTQSRSLLDFSLCITEVSAY